MAEVIESKVDYIEDRYDIIKKRMSDVLCKYYFKHVRITVEEIPEHRKELKTIKVMLKTIFGGTHQIGEIRLHPNVGNAVIDEMLQDASSEQVTIIQVGKLGIECESYAYLYQVYENDDVNHYYVEHDYLYNENGHSSEIVVGEYMSGHLTDVYMEFVNKVCERWR